MEMEAMDEERGSLGITIRWAGAPSTRHKDVYVLEAASSTAICPCNTVR